MAGNYWDSFDCQIQCEEIYHEESSEIRNNTLTQENDNESK